MKAAYPIWIIRENDGYNVYIPDFDINTQGDTIADAMEMARDAIGLMGIELEDEGKDIPEPNSSAKKVDDDNTILTLVDVDFTEYRKRNDNRSVKKNCTIPYWLSVKADEAGVNYSRTLQDALKEKMAV